MSDATAALLLRAPNDDLACFHTGKMTVRQLRALLAGNDAVIERCAQIADTEIDTWHSISGNPMRRVAAAIRALKSKP